MKKKWKIILSAFVVAILFLIGTFIFYPEWFFPGTSSTYAETIETNWGLVIPDPAEETLIKNEREFHGDGETITELHYEKSNDIQSIRNLSNSWISGGKFEVTKKELPNWINDLIKKVEKEANYFYLKKDRNDYIIFELKGNKVTVYESYI
ncbi:hypothetical protein NLX67_18865 [Domibacillus sp. A3M-37]|uniref:hypothetical protein n=1 Tax=Domibacillus sp. A3M-37 TaxID=2962037 RepID=UPI0020B71193|nr:hypothetical protein [Domibacillus sp. A3M-37]MCP3764407.1 hypothetical protein [Domibacillus sp. A3M-37]